MVGVSCKQCGNDISSDGLGHHDSCPVELAYRKALFEPPITDSVNHPSHYTSHPSGVEVITITEHMNFCLGNAVKYILRAGLKGDAITDLEKAKWYIEREIARLKKENA